MRRSGGAIAAAALLGAAAATAQMLAQSTDKLTVYDGVNNITWLADFNLPASNRFTIPLCNPSSTGVRVNTSGSMSYQSAAAWVAAMNAANYLGHSNWQIPTTPMLDNRCGKTGPNGNNYGFGCTAGAYDSLFYDALALKAPATAVPIPNTPVGPFSNFQPYLYWSQTSQGQAGYSSFSFGNGFQGANTAPNFLNVLPMIPGKIAGTPAATGMALQVNPGGQTVYDPVANVTWLANANLATTNTFGLPACKSPTNPSLCVNADGAMTRDAANQWIANMNAASYLGQTHWQLPPADLNCDVSYSCDVNAQNPFGELYYGQLGLPGGVPIVPVPDLAAGPFHNMQPYLYWSCGADTIQQDCQYIPAAGFEWSFSFNSGFLGTDVLKNNLYVTSYFVGMRMATTGPTIAEVANAEGESPAIASNTWVEIKGVNLAPAGDARIWQSSDFTGTQMPQQLDKVSATVNGKPAYVYYISPTQINILTPPDAMSGAVQVEVTNNGATAAAFTAQAQALSPSFFVFNGGPYVAAVHLNGGLIGPAALYPGSSAPAKPGETIVLYANGFGPTNVPVVSGASTQGGRLSPLPVVQIAGKNATVQFAGLVAPGQFQFNVVVPASLADGDQPIVATYSGASTQIGTLITIQH